MVARDFTKREFIAVPLSWRRLSQLPGTFVPILGIKGLSGRSPGSLIDGTLRQEAI